MRRLTFLMVSIVLTLCAGFAFAQAPTEAGTIIRNTATGSFVPADGGPAETIESNEVTTEVLPVYTINVEPDGQGPINVVTQGSDVSQPGDPGPTDGAGDPTAADDNDFNSPSGQDEVADAGETVELPYSLENLSNTPSDVLLEVIQDTTDDYDLQNVTIYEDTNGNGVLDAGEPEVTGPVTLDASDGVPGSGDDLVNFIVVGTVPADQPGGDVAEVDLIATNQTAVADGADTDAINNSYQVFENNNIATVTINEQAEVGIAKELTAGPTNNGDGTFDATFTYTLENFGNVDLTDFNVTDDFPAIFGANAVEVLSGTDGTSLTYNPTFDGTTATSIVSGGTLAAGATDAVSVNVRFTLANLSEQPSAANNYEVSFDNVADVTAVTPDGTTVADDDGSTNGTDPDPDGNGNPNGPEEDDNVPTPVPFAARPGIGLVKSADVTLTDPAAPTYEVAYTVFVENIGDVPLSNVVVTDDLLRAFTELDTGTPVAADNITIVTAPTVEFITTAPSSAEGDEVVANATFDGEGNNNLVNAGTGTLDPGEQFSVSFVVAVTPRDASGAILNGPFDNQANATSEDPAGNPVDDASDNGSSFDNIDPDGDGLGNEQDQPYDENGDGVVDPDEGVDPDAPGDGLGDDNTLNENDPTPVAFGENPLIGIAKSAGTVSDQGDGSFNVPYTLTIENFGNVSLSDVQATDDLSATFPAPSTFSVVPGSISSAEFAVNPNFDGSADQNLLAGTDTLDPNAVGTVTFIVNFNPNGESGPFNNTASVEGTSPQGTPTTDDSVDGNDPDGTNPDGTPETDGNPDDQSPTPVLIPEKAQIGVAKEAAVTANVGTVADPLYNVTYTIRVENIGNVVLDNVQVVDDLQQTFVQRGASYTVEAAPTVASGVALTPNAAFDGNADTNLLAGTESLAPGEFSILQFTVQVDPGNNFGPYNNQAIATGDSTGPSGETVTDLSDDGTQVDEDGDGLANEQVTDVDANNDGAVDPDEGNVDDVVGDGVGDDTTTDENDPTPVSFAAPSEVELLKDAYVYNSNPTTCDAATAGDPANALATGEDRFTDSTSGQATDLDTFAVPGEYICYVVTATNTGAGAVTELQITDAPPAGTFFVVSDANGATSDDGAIDIECSTDDVNFVPCDTLGATGDVIGDDEAPVTRVRLTRPAALAGATGAIEEQTALTFVVYIP